MTRSTLVPLSPNFHATPTGGRLATTYDLACNGPIYGGSSVESGFEPGALRSQCRDLTTRPQRSDKVFKQKYFSLVCKVSDSLILRPLKLPYLSHPS
ncbi:hypothetical protein AVEN_222226-1 [Araneus ventricosus]|uniref:Uncharacterized protein n=1 Tax=Araneus ventricosus TaxID=182803 RepID=A0A4Y2J8V6_ARAVE|nr:hypothetical protein AVEN_222226-1 [Araneus ventricosus]